MSGRKRPGRAVTCLVVFVAVVFICAGLVYIGLGLGGNVK